MIRSDKAHAALPWTMMMLCLSACANDAPSAEERVGELAVSIVHYDDGSSDTLYRFTTDDDGDRLDLVFREDPPLATGDRLAVVGRSMGESRLAVDSYRMIRAVDADEDDEDGVGTVDAPLTGNSVQRRSRIAVLLVHWDTPDQMTRDQMHREMFTGTTAVRDLFLESSFGILELTGDVFDWMKLPPISDCDIWSIKEYAIDAAQSRGIDLDSYDQVSFYFPHAGCGWAGRGELGTPKSPARYTYFHGWQGSPTTRTMVRAHELLHNFGAYHSRTYSCGSSPLASPSECHHSEYGDPYDPMGNGAYQFNMYQRSAQGWLGGCNAATATANGTFQIVPAGAPSNGLQVLRIPAPGSLCPPLPSESSDCFYYVEYRQPIGIFDGQDPSAQVHQGVSVRLGSAVDFSGNSRASWPYLLDMTPGSSDGFRDSALTLGRAFEDPSGLRITVDALTPERATVQVIIPGRGSGAPTCIDGSPLGTVDPGDDMDGGTGDDETGTEPDAGGETDSDDSGTEPDGDGGAGGGTDSDDTGTEPDGDGGAGGGTGGDDTGTGTGGDDAGTGTGNDGGVGAGRGTGGEPVDRTLVGGCSAGHAGGAPRGDGLAFGLSVFGMVLVSRRRRRNGSAS